MLYDVFPLRLHGIKLPADKLVAVRGRLRASRGQVIGGAEGPRWAVTASVHTRWPQPYPGHAEATLYEACLSRLDERGFVLTGREVVMSGLGADIYAQAWFCRPVLASWLPDPGQLGISEPPHTGVGPPRAPAFPP